MHVALVTEQLLAPVPGGTGRYTAELARALATGPARPPHRVSGWTAWHRDTSAAEIDGVSGPHRLPLPRRGLIAAWERGLGPVPRVPDVVHAPTLLVPPTRVPTVVTIHDAVPWTHPETLTARGVAWHRRMAERAVAGGAIITVPSAAVAADLAEVLPGLDSDRLHVLGAGVSEVLLAEPDPTVAAAALARLGVPGRFVLTLATLEPRKGLDLLIEALARLGPAAPTLVVVGQPGWGGVDPVSLATISGLDTERLLVAGRLGDVELAVLLRAATALVMPSRAEGFGLPVAEAMAVGTPVICTDVPALAEVAGGAAVLVPCGEVAALAEAIGQVDTDPALRARLSAAGREAAAPHRWANVADRAWALYRSLS